MATLALIAAVADNGVIGRDGGLPWTLPRDLARFKKVTSGHAVIMGRRTFESLPGPLPRRRNIVVTSRRDYAAPGAEVAHGLDEALRLAAETPSDRAGDGAAPSGDDAETVYVLGGAVLYEAALTRADVLDLTRVHAAPEGDTRFPEVDWSRWRRVWAEPHPSDADHAFALTFERWERADERSEA